MRLPGCEGDAFPVTASVRAGLLPQELFAVTEMVPPEVPCDTVMLLVVELPDQPPGKDHV